LKVDLRRTLFRFFAGAASFYVSFGDFRQQLFRRRTRRRPLRNGEDTISHERPRGLRSHAACYVPGRACASRVKWLSSLSPRSYVLSPTSRTVAPAPHRTTLIARRPLPSPSRHPLSSLDAHPRTPESPPGLFPAPPPPPIGVLSAPATGAACGVSNNSQRQPTPARARAPSCCGVPVSARFPIPLPRPLSTGVRLSSGPSAAGSGSTSRAPHSIQSATSCSDF
ncbi:hypothetical protein B0H15DRAFT_1024550, partial [Mycena belliarum]